jgi:hypothetical protein
LWLLKTRKQIGKEGEEEEKQKQINKPVRFDKQVSS